MAGPEDQTRDLNTSQTEHPTDLVSLSQAVSFTWGKWLKIPIIFATDEYSTIRHLSCNMTKPTKWPVRPAKTQISMGICLVWSKSLLYTWRNLGSLATWWAHSEGSKMPSLIWVFVCLCWGLTSQSTIFQSCRDGATTSWVINQYFRGVKCLAQGHNTAAVGFEPPTSCSGVQHSTT